MIASIHTPSPGCDANATGPSAWRVSSVRPEALIGTPPHELITNSRSTPSTSDHTAGLLESISAGRLNFGALTSRALGVRGACAWAVAISSAAATALLEMSDQLLEEFIGRHIGLQRRDRDVAFLDGLV